MKILPIPTCQHVISEPPARPRLCGGQSIIVLQDRDGQEFFLCALHRVTEVEITRPWHLHRREVAAGPVDGRIYRTLAVRLPEPEELEEEEQPKKRRRIDSEESRARISASCRRSALARWERVRAKRNGSCSID